MSVWKKERLASIASSDDLHVAPFREDGLTSGTPTWVWSVVVDGELYVRAYNGTGSRWHKAAMAQRAGQIASGGQTDDVIFEPVSGPINTSIDAAYSTKYASSSYLKPMIGERARAATVRISPRASVRSRGQETA